MSRATVVRQASPGDRDGVLATIVAAFAEDPGWAFILAGEYERLAAAFVAATFDARVASQNVWVTDDLAAVAMWDSPDKGDGLQGEAALAWSGYRAIAGRTACERLAGYKAAVDAVSPAEPHWYLGVLATHPDRQREGLAGAVLAPVLHEADRRGVPCGLETSTEENRRFYERRGFTTASEIALDGGPPTWWLYRPASAGLPAAGD